MLQTVPVANCCRRRITVRNSDSNCFIQILLLLYKYITAIPIGIQETKNSNLLLVNKLSFILFPVTTIIGIQEYHVREKKRKHRGIIPDVFICLYPLLVKRVCISITFCLCLFNSGHCFKSTYFCVHIVNLLCELVHSLFSHHRELVT